MTQSGILGWLAAVAAAAPSAAFAADDTAAKPKQGTYVVLVGAGQFADPAIKPRPTADADAKALYDLMTDKNYVGVPADRVALLTSEPDAKRAGVKATRENVAKAVHEAVAKTGKDDLIVLGFFGRGAPVGLDKFALFTTDSTVKERAKTAFLGADLAAELKQTDDRKLCVLMDLAFSGFDAGAEKLAEPSVFTILAAVYASEPDEKDDDAKPVVDKALYLSTDPSHDPIAKGANGLFAATLVDALKGKADTAGYEPDGIVTPKELADYLETQVIDQARTLGTTVKEKEAAPVAIGDEVSTFVVSRNPAVAPKVAERLERLEAIAAAGKLDKVAADEGRALLARMPKLKNSQELRKKFQGLADGALTPEEFAAARNQIKADLKLAPAAAERYARRVEMGVAQFASQYIKELNKGELAAAAVRGLFRVAEETVPADLDERLKAAKGFTAEQQLALLKEGRDRLGRREDLDDPKDVDLSLKSVAESVKDPNTVYLDSETVRKEESRIKAEFRGVGIHIRRDLVRDGILCVSPIKDSPAYKAGIKAGDLITEIYREVDPKGDPLPADAPRAISTRGMKTEKALEVILGKPGVPITLQVEREGEKQPLKFTIERGVVNLETVFGVKRNPADDTWDYTLDPQNKVGYIYISQFGPNTTRDLLMALRKLERAGLNGLVLDLRFNPGGLLREALTVADLFIEDGLLLSVRPRAGTGDEARIYDRGLGTFTKFKMAVLVNGGSASASEIVSAVVQDYGRGVVVGERSYGKGSVQTIDEYKPTNGEFKLTTARYFPPLGRNIDRRSTGGKPEDEWGVVPSKGFEVKTNREEKQELAEAFRDKEVIPRRDLPAKEAKPPVKDKQLEAALDHLRKEIKATARANTGN